MYFTFFANSVDALIPELWANEGLAVLEENMVAGQLIHRDFEDEIANFGDVVNTRKPAEFVAKRKGANDNVTIQDASTTNIAVPLNQHIHVSFLIRDGEESKAFQDLVSHFLRPAMLAQARMLDRVILGQFPQFLGTTFGQFGGLTGSTSKDYILGLREKMNVNKAPDMARNLILNPSSETSILANDLFNSADKVGDDGTALRQASLGMKLGFNHFMCQNMSNVVNTPDISADGLLVNNVAGYPVGTTTITVDGSSTAIPANSWIKFNSSKTPYRVVSSVGAGTPTSITITPALRHAVVNDEAITIYDEAAVNLVAGYASGYDGYIVLDSFTVAPQVGQMITFGNVSTAAVYTIIDYDSGTSSVQLDRPLEAALSNDDHAMLGPNGQYNFGFTRNAVALVVRPLAPPKSGVGALSSVVNFNGFSMRAVITYDGNKQGHLITLDMLAGVKVLDAYLGSVMFG